MGKKIRVAVVGAGGISDIHADGWARSGLAEIVAVVDSRLGAAEAKARLWGAGTACASIPEALAAKPDLIDVCTPEHVHCSNGLEALSLGLPVFLEKSLASNLTDGRALRAAARSSGLWTGMNYNYHFFPVFTQLAKAVRSQEAGELRLLNVTAHSFCFHHVLEAVLWIAGRPKRVWARGVERDWPEGFDQRFQISPELLYIPGRRFTGILEYDNGLVVNLTASLLPDLDALPFHLLAVFESGRVFEATDLEWNNNMVGRLSWLPQKDEIASGLDPSEDRAKAVSFRRSLASAAAAFLEGRPPESSWEDGWNAMLVDHALWIAGTEGQTVQLSDVEFAMGGVAR